MKRFSCLLVAACSVCALAQTPESSLTEAFKLLRQKPALVLQAVGTETHGSTSRAIEVDAWSDIDPGAPRARLKITSSMDGHLQNAWAADGVQLFQYNPLQNEYSAVIYGSFNGKPPEAMVATALQSTFALSRGGSVWPTRLLLDIYAGDSALYKTWVADAIPVEVKTKEVHTVTYENRNRYLQFTLDPQTGALLTIENWESVGAAGQSSTTHWTMTLTSLDATPSTWDFKFAPPEGCRPVPFVR